MPKSCESARAIPLNPARGVDESFDQCTFVDRFGECILESEITRRRDRNRERAAARTLRVAGGIEQDGEPQLFQQLALLRLLRAPGTGPLHVPRTGIAGQPRTKTVNGLDLESTGCFERAGKQASRQGAPLRTGLGADVADGPIELAIVERDPFGERGEHPVRHVGGRRLGVLSGTGFFAGSVPCSSSRITRCASTW